MGEARAPNRFSHPALDAAHHMTESKCFSNDWGHDLDKQNSREFLKYYRAEIHDPAILPWDLIKADIIQIESSAFEGSMPFDEVFLEQNFTSAEGVAILLRDIRNGGIVGFTCARPTLHVYPEEFPERAGSEDTAYIYNTAIEPRHQGRRLVALLMEGLEAELTRRGYVYLERDSSDIIFGQDRQVESYADKIRRNYSGRILREERHDSEYGPQVFF